MVRRSCRGDGHLTAMRLDHPAVGQQLAGVLEDHDAVAEQAPALLRVADQHAGGLPVDTFSRGTSWVVRAHERLLIGTSTGTNG